MARTSVNNDKSNSVSPPPKEGYVGDEPQVRQKELPGGLHSVGEVRILVLDDDKTICKMIQAALAQNDFTIDMVSDPAQNKGQLQAKPYHIVILDYVIPGLESEKVLNWVHEFQPEASIIVVTAFPSIDSALNCLRAHTYDYLTKPFQVEQLQKIVTRCLESKGLLRMSEEALRESLGAAIRERRKALGLTLAEMSKRTNLSLGYLSQIELGKNSASIETLYRISLGLGVKMADLFQSVQSSS
ncbi:MAG: response regulator [Planctomycetes bacterium]|nr:response regulator [Planctomycetota bacterium]